jgi:hypothetical protein
MFEGISLTALTPIGMFVLVAGFPYLQMARGKLIPRSTYDDVINDRNEWRVAHATSEAARMVGADQVEELLEHARTTDAFIRALPPPPSPGSGS